MQLYRSAASFAIRWTMNACLLTVARAGGALHTQAQQGSSLVQSTAWMERRRPTLPEESSERARGLLCAKRIKKFRLRPKTNSGDRLHSAAATTKGIAALHRQSLETYLGQLRQCCNAQRAVISPEQGSHKEQQCSQRS